MLISTLKIILLDNCIHTIAPIYYINLNKLQYIASIYFNIHLLKKFQIIIFKCMYLIDWLPIFINVM